MSNAKICNDKKLTKFILVFLNKHFVVSKSPFVLVFVQSVYLLSATEMS